jgi:hypothetical protein
LRPWKSPAPEKTIHPITPDGRYFVVRGRLWRTTNPALPEAERQALVDRLMIARRAMGVARRAGDRSAGAVAKAEVHAVKLALGERGPVWWDDHAPDWNRHLARNSPYADWCASFQIPPGTAG